MYDDRSYSWTLDFDYDLEYDTAEFSVKLYEDDESTVVSPTPSWFYVKESDNTHRIAFRVENPEPAVAGTPDIYFIKVTLTDGLESNVYKYKLTVKTNNAPVYK